MHGKIEMTKFIRVSEVCGNDVTKTVLINADHIEHVKVGNKGTDTFIKLITPSRTNEAKGSWFFVKESLEQIEQQLGVGLAVAPTPRDIHGNPVTFAQMDASMGYERATSIAKSLRK